MSNIVNKLFKNRSNVVEQGVRSVSFGNYKLRPTIESLPLVRTSNYTSEDIRGICESLDPEFMSKYYLRIMGGKIINMYLFVRAGNIRSQGNTKYMQLDLDTFEVVNEWNTNEFPETIEIGEYNA